MKRTLWTVLLLAALVAVVAACTAPAPAPPGGAGAAGQAAPEVIELDVEATPLPADWLMTAPEENPKRGGTVRTAWGMAPTHFDIHQGGGCAGCAMMYNGLIMWNVADGYHTIVPALATGWSVSEDQLVYTFNLREGVKFQDGTDFNADDVVATFDRIINPPSNVSISGIREQLAMVESVSAVDDLTVQFTLQQPTPFFLEILAGDSMVVYSREELE
ncbi:MAG TPA: ABC transporter substrate-binding protein, partial [Caldilineaceae bacterium]|nr:ABC transporter substrate-binding protein [Caldilineaceae bacterium]